MPKTKSTTVKKPKIIETNGQEVDTTNSLLQASPLKDRITSLRNQGIREYPFLTTEQAQTNPFDPKTDNYGYLARKTMLVLSKQDLEELDNMGGIVIEGKSRVYGDHSVMILSGITL